jgi:hypothetical protein
MSLTCIVLANEVVITIEMETTVSVVVGAVSVGGTVDDGGGGTVGVGGAGAGGLKWRQDVLGRKVPRKAGFIFYDGFCFLTLLV